MKVAKWGNSLAVRLPASVVEALNLREGDEVTLESPAKGVLRVVPELSKEELWAKLQHLRQFRGRLPADFKFDRDEANER